MTMFTRLWLPTLGLALAALVATPALAAGGAHRSAPSAPNATVTEAYAKRTINKAVQKLFPTVARGAKVRLYAPRKTSQVRAFRVKDGRLSYGGEIDMAKKSGVTGVQRVAVKWSTSLKRNKVSKKVHKPALKPVKTSSAHRRAPAPRPRVHSRPRPRPRPRIHSRPRPRPRPRMHSRPSR
jgi:hypothetical protein